MKQVIYVLQFKGSAAPVSDGVLKASTRAPSCSISTDVGPDGLRSRLETKPGAEAAAFESTVTMTGESSFKETGTIEFGRGHRLRFSTVGEGYLGPSADPTVKHGCVIWRVDGGEGQFAGATGLITSNFTVGQNGEVVDNHFGVLSLG
jgi:hypothetical protein